LGGDIAVAGSAPADGWSIAIGDDHRTAEAAPDALVAIRGGGLATSSIVARRWLTNRGPRHHLIDPRTGENPHPYWRTVSVAAGTALAANAAATAAIILGERATNWLSSRRLPARLVGVDDAISTTCGWPDESAKAV
jgi:thiamine biosynthesis lipoprotein